MKLTETQKNHRKVRKAWIKALRSGKYKQTRGTLKELNKKGVETFCCLGVLCDLAVKAQVAEETKELSDDNPWFYFDGEEYHIPPAVLEWAGINDEDGTFYTKNGDQKTLIELNDDEHRKFKTIANIIEKYPEGLFVD